MLYINVERAVKDIEREFKGVDPTSVALSIARAINHVAAKAKTQSSRQIRGTFKVRASDLNKAIVVVKATRAQQTGYVVHTGQPLPLRAFQPRQTKTGVSVNIKGQRKTVAHAFIQTLNSGSENVFARGMYTDKFNFRTKRNQRSFPAKRGDAWPNDLPITILRTKSIPGMLLDRTILSNVKSFIDKEFPDRMKHELTRLVQAK